MALVERIISGGQNGADIAGLRAGLRLHLQTGGWMPQGFRTVGGPRPEYVEAFGVQEHECRGYPPRTRRNVAESDGTVRLAYNFNSPGEICTLRAIEEFEKPYIDIPIHERNRRISGSQMFSFIRWLREADIRVLNVAGNSASWVEPVVEQFLVGTIRPHNLSEIERMASEVPMAEIELQDDESDPF